VDVFDHLGADPWSEMARAELAATGETARRRDATTLNDLTPQELQIALSLAAGRTTRETAAALFLSPKTIEYHLRNVYRKLSIGSRNELTAAMTRLGSSRLPHWRGAGRRCWAGYRDEVSGLIDKNRSIMRFTCSGTSSWRK
jgi:DNA-binding CsgD family transcriptional regulator